MTTTAPSLSSALTGMLSAVVSIIDNVVSTIAANADIIGTVLVVGALVALVVKFGSGIFRQISGFFSGFKSSF